MKLNSRSRLLSPLLAAVMCSLVSGQAFAAPAPVKRAKPAAKPPVKSTYARIPVKTAVVKPKPPVVRLRIEVPCRAWVPTGTQPSIVLLCVHGLGLNSASYENFGQRMSKAGIATFAVDVRGFGTWMKLEGKHQLDFDSCLADVEQALKVLHTAYPGRPVFVLGESMGGAIALRVTAMHPELVDGLISSVPSGDRFHATKSKLAVALKVMTFRMNKEMDVGSKVIEQATDNLTVRTAWKEDPFNRLTLTPKELIQFQRFMNDNHETARKIDRTPVLFVAGMNDKLVKPQGTIDLFEELTTPDKKLLTIESAEHLIFEQSQCTPQVFSAVFDWLQARKKTVSIARSSVLTLPAQETEVITGTEPTAVKAGYSVTPVSSSAASVPVRNASYSSSSYSSAASALSSTTSKKTKKLKKTKLDAAAAAAAARNAQFTQGPRPVKRSIFDEVHSGH